MMDIFSQCKHEQTQIKTEKENQLPDQESFKTSLDPGGKIISVFLPPFSKSSWRQIGIKAPRSAVSHHEIIQLTPMRPRDWEEGRKGQGDGCWKDRNKTGEWEKTRNVNWVNTAMKNCRQLCGRKGERDWKRGPIDRERSCEIGEGTGSEKQEEFSKVNENKEAGGKASKTEKWMYHSVSADNHAAKNPKLHFQVWEARKRRGGGGGESQSWLLLQKRIEVAAIEVYQL